MLVYGLWHRSKYQVFSDLQRVEGVVPIIVEPNFAQVTRKKGACGFRAKAKRIQNVLGNSAFRE